MQNTPARRTIRVRFSLWNDNIGRKTISIILLFLVIFEINCSKTKSNIKKKKKNTSVRWVSCFSTFADLTRIYLYFWIITFWHIIYAHFREVLAFIILKRIVDWSNRKKYFLGPGLSIVNIQAIDDNEFVFFGVNLFCTFIFFKFVESYSGVKYNVETLSHHTLLDTTISSKISGTFLPESTS